ncbi:MAG TPA: hypothetical protein VEF53_05945 [Patescibacteria group bacterium]|nr:hypothetical protein [Patescibacteria group bacterium]
MKKITCLMLIMLLLIAFSTSVFAGTISGSNYVVFEGFSPDWGYNNWGIFSQYYGDVTSTTTSKTISKHDILAYSDVENHDYGVGDYFMTSLTISADSTKLRTYFSLGLINRDYIVNPDSYYYIFDGIASGTSMSSSKQGNVEILFTFDHDDFASFGSWTNYISKNF